MRLLSDSTASTALRPSRCDRLLQRRQRERAHHVGRAALRSELYRNRLTRCARASGTRELVRTASPSLRAESASRSVKSIVTPTACASPVAPRFSRDVTASIRVRRGLPGCFTISRASIRPSVCSPNPQARRFAISDARARTPGPAACAARRRIGARAIRSGGPRSTLCDRKAYDRRGAEMSPLDCVVYLADSLEPHRKFPERAALWELALRDLTGATRETMRLSDAASSKKLLAEGDPIRELIDVVRESALDKKGEAFTALDVGGRTILADTFAIVTGRSKIQTRAIADAVMEAVAARRLRRFARRGIRRRFVDPDRSRQRNRPRLHAGAAHFLQFGTPVGIRHASTARVEGSGTREAQTGRPIRQKRHVPGATFGCVSAFGSSSFSSHSASRAA